MAAVGPTGRIFVTGATGLLGSRLCDDLARSGHPVVALSRRAAPPSSAPGVRWVRGDAAVPGGWADELEGAAAVVHLAGEPIAAGRWTRARKVRLVSSRVEAARRIAAAVAAAARPPRVLVSASACGYYGAAGERVLDESSPPGDDFLARLCVDWEAAARAAEESGVRVVPLRLGVVLSRRGGAFARMLPAFRLGLGGPLGPAERFFPWIHEEDAIRMIRWALGLEADLDAPSGGPVNAVAPEAVRMREFASELGRALHRPALLRVPLSLLRLALGEAAAGLVPGQRVVPGRAIAAGFRFRHESLRSALAALV